MRRLLWIIAVLLFLTGIGVGWFCLVEGWSLLDALYMTVITISTVGYNEVRPLSDRSRVFIMVFLTCGLGVFLFAVAQLGEMIVRSELGHWFRRRGMSSTLKSVNDHFIVCGFGRMGRTICQRLADRQLPFVVVDRDEEAFAECEAKAWPCVRDDVTNDRTLLDAGIERARGLAAVLDSDSDNLYVVMSARMIAPRLQIIARSVDEASGHKMERAGANRVVSLYTSSAATIAQLLVNPHVEDFMQIFSAAGTALDLADIRITADSPYANRALSDTDFRQRGVIIVAIRRPDGEVLLPPSAATVIEPEDELIALGTVSAVSQFLAGEARSQ